MSQTQLALSDRQRQAIRAAVQEIDPVQLTMVMKLTPAQRAEIALSMIRAGEAAAVSSLRRRRPELNESEALKAVRSRA